MSVCEKLRELRAHKVVFNEFTFLLPTVDEKDIETIHYFKTEDVLVVARFARLTAVHRKLIGDLNLLSSSAVLDGPGEIFCWKVEAGSAVADKATETLQAHLVGYAVTVVRCGLVVTVGTHLAGSERSADLTIRDYFRTSRASQDLLADNVAHPFLDITKVLTGHFILCKVII